MAGIAGGALTAKRAETSLANNEFDRVTAKCDKGTRAVSGGFNAPGSGPESTGARNLAFLSKRTGRGEWTNAGHNSGGSTGDFVGYVYCSDVLPRLEARSAPTTIGPDQAGSASAHCPEGGEAVSGGFIAQDNAEDTDPFPFKSRRVGANLDRFGLQLRR